MRFCGEFANSYLNFFADLGLQNLYHVLSQIQTRKRELETEHGNRIRHIMQTYKSITIGTIHKVGSEQPTSMQKH